jgi:hypothetical protein
MRFPSFPAIVIAIALLSESCASGSSQPPPTVANPAPTGTSSHGTAPCQPFIESRDGVTYVAMCGKLLTTKNGITCLTSNPASTSSKEIQELKASFAASLANIAEAKAGGEAKRLLENGVSFDTSSDSAKLLDSIRYALCESLQNKVIESGQYASVMNSTLSAAKTGFDPARREDLAKSLEAEQKARSALLNQMIALAETLTKVASPNYKAKESIKAEAQKLADAGKELIDAEAKSNEALLNAVTPQGQPVPKTSP